MVIMGLPLIGAYYFLFWHRVKISWSKRKLLKKIYEETAYLNLQTESVLDRLEARNPGLARQGIYPANGERARLLGHILPVFSCGGSLVSIFAARITQSKKVYFYGIFYSL